MGMHRRKKWSRWAISTFLPWDEEQSTRLQGGYKWLESWSKDLLAVCRAGAVDEQTSIDRCRFSAILNCTHALLVSEAEKKATTMFRFHNVDDFSADGRQNICGGLNRNAFEQPATTNTTEASAEEMVDILHYLADLDFQATGGRSDKQSTERVDKLELLLGIETLRLRSQSRRLGQMMKLLRGQRRIVQMSDY